MVNRGMLIVIGAGAVIIVGVIAGAVIMNRHGVVPTPVSGGVTGPVGGDGTTVSGAVEGQKVLCGDGICSPSETAQTCFSDCVPKDVVRDLAFVYGTGNSITVTWSTPEPMTSIVEYRKLPDGGRTVAEDGNLKTDHSMDLTRLESGEYETRIGGEDSDGDEYFVEGYQFEL